MQKSNRPYSYINVFDNLRKKIPKGKVIASLGRVTSDQPLLSVCCLPALNCCVCL